MNWKTDDVRKAKSTKLNVPKVLKKYTTSQAKDMLKNWVGECDD